MAGAEILARCHIPGMSAPVAIVLAAFIIGAAILIAGRWSIAPHGGDSAVLYRLDRWTGQVETCLAPPLHEMVCK